MLHLVKGINFNVEYSSIYALLEKYMCIHLVIYFTAKLCFPENVYSKKTLVMQ